jgi:hypothetical protein
MKNIWKWILGIVLVLVVVGALVAVPFVMRNYMAANFSQSAAQGAPQPNLQQRGPMMRGFNQPGQAPYNGFRGPMMGGGRNFQRGFMRFGGFGPFAMGFMFLGGLLHLAIPLLLLGLLLFGVYQLGKNAGRRSVQVVAAPVAAPAAPSAVDETPGETPAG